MSYVVNIVNMFSDSTDTKGFDDGIVYLTDVMRKGPLSFDVTILTDSLKNTAHKCRSNFVGCI